MTPMFSEAKLFLTEWIDAVARAVDTVAGRIVRARQIRLAEGDDGSFTATTVPAKGKPGLPDLSFRLAAGQPRPPLPSDWKAAFRGSRVEVQLPPAQIMTHQLDFPVKAADFLDGMIRSQIDRLTPWTLPEAVFGFSAPVRATSDRIEVVFAATSRQKLNPVLELAGTLDAASIAVYAPAQAGLSEPIPLMDQKLRSLIGAAVDVPRLLRMLLLAAVVAAAASLLANAYLGGSLQSELGDLRQQISQRRAALRLGVGGPGGGLGLLAKRKQATPSSVMVLDAISRALPDSTYVTELRIEEDKVQVVGMTQDAPSLIRLMEQSPQFSRATFFAPTTHAANEPGDRFHIEAHINPHFGSGT
jgi:general secretion pathway protein L